MALAHGKSADGVTVEALAHQGGRRLAPQVGVRAALNDGEQVLAVARAEGVTVAADVVDRIVPYIDNIPGTMRSSLLIDLQQGKRIEVEALQGAVVRRGAALGVPTPIIAALYSVLKLHAIPRA